MFVASKEVKISFDGEEVVANVSAIEQEDALTLAEDIRDPRARNVAMKQILPKYISVLKGPSLDTMLKYFYFQALLARFAEELLAMGEIENPKQPGAASVGSQPGESLSRTSVEQ